MGARHTAARPKPAAGRPARGPDRTAAGRTRRRSSAAEFDARRRSRPRDRESAGAVATVTPPVGMFLPARRYTVGDTASGGLDGRPGVTTAPRQGPTHLSPLVRSVP
ncbi:hypothetical protein TR51_05070 [Kitasatospora griseola]|uniref:Uncharacterized protein n=1 Tax=Kitasatospora griseola TaxID=2064 RepID=A0A0D0PWL0_KITGR|nr:hypothetical protein TR51_05070 [Kitasatospora griseola]